VLMHVRVINTYIWSEDWLGGQISLQVQPFPYPMAILAATSVSFGRKRRRHAHASRYSTRTSPRPRERGLLVPSSILHPQGLSSPSARQISAFAWQLSAPPGETRIIRGTACAHVRQLMKAPPHAEYLSLRHVETAGRPAP
jgi:hypothetical protein